MREIPETAVQIQIGLYQDLKSFTLGSTTHYYSELYSSEGYCFYDKTLEIYDDEGNVIPEDEILPTQRVYMQYCATPVTDVDTLNATFVSVPVDPSYEIVSVSRPNEVA